MKIGVHFPQGEIGSDHKVIRDFVQSIEELGFGFVNVPDHVVQTRTPRGPLPLANNYTTQFPHHETMTTLAFMAGVTKTLELKSAVIILPQRQAVLVAKQAAQIDVLSGGRMQLGLGIGWNEPEYEALDMNYRNRAKRFEEQIEVCRKLWTEQHLTYSGRWHTINDAGLAPMPIQQPIPIWIGAIADPAVRRAGRLADGWQVIAMDQAGDATKAKFESFYEAAREAGRDPATIGVEATVWAGEESPDVWANMAHAWSDMGVTQLVFRPRGQFPEIQKAIEAFAPLLNDL
jgi:probable F420-dependent oxidoreductase